MYMKAAAQLTIGDKSYTAEWDIEPTHELKPHCFSDAYYELGQEHDLVIHDADYTQDPILDKEKVHDGTLELGVILPSGQAVYNTTLSVKVLCNKLD